MKRKQFDFKRVFPCFFLTLALLTVPAFASDTYVFPVSAELDPSLSESLSLTALLQTMTEVFSMACEWMEAVCFAVVSHPILLLGVLIGFIGTGTGLFQRLLNL